MTALVPYRRAKPRRVETKRGARDVLQCALEGIAAEVRIDRVDAHTGSSRYALRLAAADVEVRGRLLGELRSGAVIELGVLEVAPGSSGNASFAVTAPRRVPYAAMILEITSAGVLLRAEVPHPPRGRAPVLLRIGAACAAIGGAVTVCAVLFGNMLPHPSPVAAPVSVASVTHRRPAHLPVPAHAHALPLVARVAVPPIVVPRPEATRAVPAWASFADGLIAVHGRVLGGRPLRLRLFGNSTVVHVWLQDEAGATLDERTIAPGTTATAVELPDVWVATNYVLVVRSVRNGGEESAVRSIAVLPVR